MLYTYTAYILEYLVYFGILVATVTATSSLIGIKPPEQKYLALDGLRGICAALVAIFHLFWRNGGAADDYWSLDYISFSQVKSAIFITGQLPVGIFFMLSGFLFFKKALAPTFNYRGFALSRLARIYPPVIATLALIYAATFIMHPGSHTSPDEWFISSLPFLFEPPAAVINGTTLQIATSGIFWTLVWELRLYLAIPFLYLLMRHIKHATLFVIFLMALVMGGKYLLGSDERLAYVMYFLVGFLVATIKSDKRPSDLICLALLIAAIAFTRHAYNPTTALYMLVVFYTVKCGCDYFGLLTSLPLRMLGTCSFSLYLVHGITQTVARHYLYSAGHYLWQVCALVAAGVIAPVMYKWVESKCMWKSAPAVQQLPSN